MTNVSQLSSLKSVGGNLENAVRELGFGKPGQGEGAQTGKSGENFLDYLQEGMAAVNTLQQKADVMATHIAIGKSENIHETMLALSQAELSFNFMVQVRNKAIETYQEIMRMQV